MLLMVSIYVYTVFLRTRENQKLSQIDSQVARHSSRLWEQVPRRLRRKPQVDFSGAKVSTQRRMTTWSSDSVCEPINEMSRHAQT